MMLQRWQLWVLIVLGIANIGVSLLATLTMK